MGNAEAEELGRFRRSIDGIELEKLAPVIATTLDEMILLLRRIDPGNYGVEVAAALAAELHKRNGPPLVLAPTVGNA